MKPKNEFAIKVLDKIITLEHLYTDLEHAGVSITRLDDLPFDLFDDVLDVLGFTPANTPIILKNGRTIDSSRDYIHTYFSEVYRKKSADEIYNELLIIKEEQDRLGEDFTITPFLPR